jgi:hypothetical protein
MKDSEFYAQILQRVVSLIMRHGWASSGKEARKHELHLRVLRLRDFPHCILLHSTKHVRSLIA